MSVTALLTEQFILKHRVWVIVPVVCLVLLSGCGSIKFAMRDASETLSAIAILSQQDNDEVPERLYIAEEHILVSCEALFNIVIAYVVGEKTPLTTWLEALFSTKDCHQAVVVARQELEETNIQYDEITIVN